MHYRVMVSRIILGYYGGHRSIVFGHGVDGVGGGLSARGTRTLGRSFGALIDVSTNVSLKMESFHESSPQKGGICLGEIKYHYFCCLNMGLFQ